MWKIAGAGVASKNAAWSEVEGEIEVVAEVAPRAGEWTSDALRAFAPARR